MTSDARRELTPADLGRSIHVRLQQLRNSGEHVEITDDMEAILLNDPTYERQRDGVVPEPNPGMLTLLRIARQLRTGVSAIVGENPHPPLYDHPPSELERQRHRVHAAAQGVSTPFTAVLYEEEDEAGTTVTAYVPEVPGAVAIGLSHDEALQRLAITLDAMLVRNYERARAGAEQPGRRVAEQPFPFAWPGDGRVS